MTENNGVQLIHVCVYSLFPLFVNEKNDYFNVEKMEILTDYNVVSI